MFQMEPKETETPPRKQPRQHPCVPFVWEERPGLSKKNWQPSLPTFVPSPPQLPPPIPVPVKLTPGKLLLKLTQPPSETATTTPLPPPVPVKLVMSAPFCWEETPGKQAPSSANDRPKLPQLPSKTVTTPSLPPPVPVPVKAAYPCFVDFNPPYPLDQPLTPPPMYGCEAETSSSDIYDDASSDSVSSVPISGAFTTSSMPTSPAYDTDDSTSSYMTGASFLEKLFPRIPQEMVEAADSHHVQVTTASNDINFGFPERTQYTLRELIMMSLRRSYMRRPVEMRKHNPPMEFTKYDAESSCLFEPDIKMIEGREWKRYQLMLKPFQKKTLTI
ncbi:hypothetical protein N665_0032s0035, partial [Sinapis alba]